MQTDPRRKTHVMTIGQTDAQWQEWKGDVKGALQTIHMGWSFGSEKATSVTDAVSRIAERDHLEIVFFSNENSPNQEQLFKDALMIAAALTEHKRKPWVILDFGLEYLQSLFEGFGIKTKNPALIGYTVHERWVSQMEHEVAVQ